MDFFFRGFVIGVSIAAPVGPIGLLCIQRTLTHGRAVGFISGLGAATADALYGSVAGFGIGAIAHFLLAERVWIHLIGGLMLLGLGLRGLRRTPSETPREAAPARSWGWSYGSILILTITNPMTVVSFMAIFAALGVANSAHVAATAGWTVAGVFSGSATWWFALSQAAGWLRNRFAPTHLVWVGRGSALVLMGFGVWATLSAWG